MYVVSFLNPKGGCGKTTAAILLAEQIMLAGGSVAVLDLDPNNNLVIWDESRNQENINNDLKLQIFGRDLIEDGLLDFIEKIQSDYDYLIIDLEGTKDQIITFAISKSDYCVIPMDGSAMEAREAANAVKLVKQTSKLIGYDIPYGLLFTRMNAAFQSSDEREVRAELVAANINILPVRLAKRSPFTRIFRDYMLLFEMKNEIKSAKRVNKKNLEQINSAISNSKEYAQAVINGIREEVTEKNDG